MNPVRFVGRQEHLSDLRHRLNEVLAFVGFQVGDDGKLRQVAVARTLDEATERAGRLRRALSQRNVHADVLLFCRAELLQENYFHAVFEATKSIADKIRGKSGLATDGAELVDTAFSVKNPVLAINTLQSETEQSEQKGFANLLKGVFGTFRNVTAHAPKIKWPIEEQDALDLLTMVSYLHRRLDRAVKVPRASSGHGRRPTRVSCLNVADRPSARPPPAFRPLPGSETPGSGARRSVASGVVCPNFPENEDWRA
jgi:uncharacterized protein (TIGR02391 family)